MDGNGHLISYQLSSGGVVGVAPTTVPLTAGVFSTTIPDTSLTIPPYVNTSYTAYFMYDGANCIGMVAH